MISTGGSHYIIRGGHAENSSVKRINSDRTPPRSSILTVDLAMGAMNRLQAYMVTFAMVRSHSTSLENFCKMKIATVTCRAALSRTGRHCCHHSARRGATVLYSREASRVCLYDRTGAPNYYVTPPRCWYRGQLLADDPPSMLIPMLGRLYDLSRARARVADTS